MRVGLITGVELITRVGLIMGVNIRMDNRGIRIDNVVGLIMQGKYYD